MEKPKRRFEVTIKIGADEWRHVEAELRFLSFHLKQYGETCASVSGSPSSNHTVEIEQNPEMTHDRYHSELCTYLDFLRTERATGKET